MKENKLKEITMDEQYWNCFGQNSEGAWKIKQYSSRSKNRFPPKNDTTRRRTAKSNDTASFSLISSKKWVRFEVNRANIDGDMGETVRGMKD